ncbi:hypothetical protein [Acidisphaera sp. L21]|uniref:hypothetical protein n=1 Tax=Acidisphaera sp. L21 TaxID=1641851 RepID=UPI00131E85DF|nr:hypothetical protein [Acidisphaera sp. L21]
MIVRIDTLEAEIANSAARDLQCTDSVKGKPSLVSPFHEVSADGACGKFASSLLPATMVIAAIIKARHKLAALGDASSDERNQFDRICEATIFTTASRPAERRVRLTSADAQVVRDWVSLN